MTKKPAKAGSKGAPRARTSGQKGSADADGTPQETGKTEDLAPDTMPPGPTMTNNQGVGISDDQNSLKSHVRGPTLLEDIMMREKITHFDHERIPERVVHARGSAAHGFFQVYEDLSDITMAQLFRDPEDRKRRSSYASPPSLGRAVRRTRPAMCAALPSNSTRRRAFGILSATTCRCSSYRMPSSFPTSSMR